MELDIIYAIDLLKHHNDFWDSYLFNDSLKKGDFFALDYNFFVKEILSRTRDSYFYY
jgi:hypothetical protein